MKKIFLLIIFGSLIVFGQNGGQNLNKPYLPTVTPPSPESFAFTEYGKNGISEYSGKLNIPIPIYNHTVGNLNLSISLNYSGAGVKVNDIASSVGMNWNLIAGGVINRTISDLPDEISDRDYIDKAHLFIHGANTCAPDAETYKNYCFDNNTIDTQIDVFSFTFNGYSGSFYLDENFNPIYIENENEIKIEIIGTGTTNLQKLRNSNSFVIITPDGVKYYFGGVDSIEGTSYNNGRPSNLIGSGITSYYLYKISDTNNEIFIEYKNLAAKDLFINKYYKMRTTAFHNNINNIFQNPPQSNSTTSKMVVNPKIISKIFNNKNSEEIIFNSTYYKYNNHYNNVMNSIEFFNNNVLIKSVDFEYVAKLNTNQANNNFDTANRFFLEKVIFDKNKNNNEIYKFEYNDPFGLPNRLSNSQDILGYYNGKINQTLIPARSGELNVSSSFANRGGDFAYASKGSLKKIIYPTKGYSCFEYESVPARKDKYQSYYLEVSNLSGSGPTTINLPGYNEILNSYMDFESIYKNQEVEIEIQITNPNDLLIRNFIGNEYKNKGVELIITKLGTSPLQQTIFTKLFNNFDFETMTVNYVFEKDAMYSFKLKLTDNAMTTTEVENNSIFGSATFRIFKGYDVVDNFGVRIKKQHDVSDENNMNNNIKRYYYSLINRINIIEDLPTVYIEPEYSFDFVSLPPTEIYPTLAEQNGLYITLHSNTKSSLEYINELEYNNVVSTSFGGDNFEDGGNEKYFLNHSNELLVRLQVQNDGCYNEPLSNVLNCSGQPSNISTAITTVRDNANSTEKERQDYFNGSLLNERFYKKVSGQLFKIKEVDYLYDDALLIPAEQETCFVGYKIFSNDQSNNVCVVNGVQTYKYPLSGCYIGYYHVNKYNKFLRGVITTNYIEPIPINLNKTYVSNIIGIEDNYISSNFDFYYNGGADVLNSQIVIESPFKKIKTTQNFEYGALRGLPSVVTTNTSDSAIVNKTVNTYVNTASALLNIPGNQNAIYSSLISENRLSSPVQVQQYQNTELLSTQRTLFNNFTVNNITKILPEIIQIAKGDLTLNPLEDKAIFYNYDEHFNPVVVGYKDAPKTRYMFNTEGLVVSKIENYTGTSTTFPLIAGNIDNTSCGLQTQYPNSNVTVFTYNLVTKKLVQITDSRCQNSFYVYDDLHRLKLIKDHDGNIVKEFDQQFKN